jgi:hypothetical protein
VEAVSLSYSGPATLRVNGRWFDVHAEISTDVSGGVYSWGGRLVTSDLAALNLKGQGGTLTLPVPDVSAEVHVVVAELDSHAGVVLRVDGTGRAPYEQPGEIVGARMPDGSTFYQWMEPGSSAGPTGL